MDRSHRVRQTQGVGGGVDSIQKGSKRNVFKCALQGAEEDPKYIQPLDTSSLTAHTTTRVLVTLARLHVVPQAVARHVTVGVVIAWLVWLALVVCTRSSMPRGALYPTKLCERI